jgi:hypothetical protein
MNSNVFINILISIATISRPKIEEKKRVKV